MRIAKARPQRRRPRRWTEFDPARQFPPPKVGAGQVQVDQSQPDLGEPLSAAVAARLSKTSFTYHHTPSFRPRSAKSGSQMGNFATLSRNVLIFPCPCAAVPIDSAVAQETGREYTITTLRLLPHLALALFTLN